MARNKKYSLKKVVPITYRPEKKGLAGTFEGLWVKKDRVKKLVSYLRSYESSLHFWGREEQKKFSMRTKFICRYIAWCAKVKV